MGVFFGINLLGVYVFKDSNGEVVSFWILEFVFDFQGGIQIVFSVEMEDGVVFLQEQLDQVVVIICQCVDVFGVVEVDIMIEGGQNIVVQIFGEVDVQIWEWIQFSVQLEFCLVLFIDVVSIEFVGEDGNLMLFLIFDFLLNVMLMVMLMDVSDLLWVIEKLVVEFQVYDCVNLDNDFVCVLKDQLVIVCLLDDMQKFIFGLVEFDGMVIMDVIVGCDLKLGVWIVQLIMNGEGVDVFGKVSMCLNQNCIDGFLFCDQFVFVFDGDVISVFCMNGQIFDGCFSILGSFMQEIVIMFVDQFKFGVLLFSFMVQSFDMIFVILGMQQLQIGLIVGFIGFVFVVIYFLVVYCVFGLVIIVFIVVMVILIYIIICILVWCIGFCLLFVGVVGLIVLIGFIVDLFIVYFE